MFEESHLLQSAAQGRTGRLGEGAGGPDPPPITCTLWGAAPDNYFQLFFAMQQLDPQKGGLTKWSLCRLPPLSQGAGALPRKRRGVEVWTPLPAT